MATIITGFTNWLWSVVLYILVALVNSFITVFNYFIELLASFAYAVTAILPEYTVPALSSFIEQSSFLSTLNWLLPISFFIDCLSMLVFGYAAFYIFGPALRWVKLLR
jgi:hypothetical protein